MAKLKLKHQSANSGNLSKVAITCNVEKVKTMRCFWEMKFEPEAPARLLWLNVGKALYRLMKSKAQPMENFVAAWDVWLVNGMCLVASYLWGWMCELLCYRRRHRTSNPPAFKVEVPPNVQSECFFLDTTHTIDRIVKAFMALIGH